MADCLTFPPGFQKAPAVLRQQPIGLDGLVVGLGAVALVFAKAVLRVLLVQLAQDPVPADFGQDGRRRHAGAFGVPLDDGLPGDGKGRHPVAVDEGVVRRDPQGLHRTAHGQEGGLEDVHPVDLLHGAPADAVGQGLFPYHVEQGLPLLLGELL